MTLTEICMEKKLDHEENQEEACRQADSQAVPADAEHDSMQGVQAETPAEVHAEVEASSTPAEVADAPAGGMQDGGQSEPAETPVDVMQEAESEAHARTAKEGGATSSLVESLLPPKKEKATYLNVTMRLAPSVKAAAQVLAQERGMSLSEFCATVIDRLVRQAAGRDSRAA